jgi:hypothetical protein
MLFPGLEVSMPKMCFSYLTDVPPDSQNLSAMRSAPAGLRQMPFSCFSYPFACFSYPDDVPGGSGNRDAAEPSLRHPRRMPHTCLRY